MASSFSLSRRQIFKIDTKYALAYFKESDVLETSATQHICTKVPKIGNKEQMKFRQGLFEGTIIALSGE